MEARKWLRTNGYDDVADLIDSIMREWQAAGVHDAIGGMFLQVGQTDRRVS